MKDFVKTEAGTLKILQNNFFNFMNDSYESVSSTTFNRIKEWAEIHGMKAKDILPENVLSKLNEAGKERVFFTNDEFCNFLDSLYSQRPKRFIDWDKNDFFHHIGFSSGNSFENALLDHVFPRIFGKNLRDVAIYSSLYASHATRQRIPNYSVSYVPINKDAYESVSVDFSTFPGIITRESEATLLEGYVQKVLKRATNFPVYNSSFKFSPLEGNITITATSTKSEKGNLDWRKRIKEANSFVKTMVSHLIESKLETETRQESLENIISTFTTSIFKDLTSLKRADRVSGEHNIRVGRKACEIASLCGLSRREQRAIAYGAPQHDLGKVVIPQSILLDEGFLGAEKYRLMQEHTSFGALMTLNNGMEIIESIFTPSMKKNLDSRFRKGFSDTIKNTLEDLVVQGSSIALYHQEYANGKGYPIGIHEENTSRAIRMVQVVDFEDAFSSPRPYKDAKSQETVLRVLNEELEKGHFDYEIGNFLINRYFSQVYEPNSFFNWEYEKQTIGDNNQERLVVGALRGNIPLSRVYSEDLIEEGREVFSSKPEIYYTKNGLEKEIREHLVGLYEDLRFQERLRKHELKNNGDRDYSLLRNGRIYDVHALPLEDIYYLRQQYPDETLDSQEYIRLLESRIHDNSLVGVLKESLVKNQKYRG